MRAALPLLAGLSLSACSSMFGDAGLVVQSIIQTRAEPVLPGFGSGLQPQYRYLLVHPVGGTPAVFILGTERSTPQGLWEAWYSKDGAFIETFNGQLANIRAYSVQWASGQWLVHNNVTTRSRDVVSQHLFSVTDAVTAQPASVASLPVPFKTTLNQHAPSHASWQWSSQSYQTVPPQGALLPAWFAHGTHRGKQWVVASYQCVNASVCLRMLRWPVTEANPE